MGDGDTIKNALSLLLILLIVYQIYKKVKKLQINQKQMLDQLQNLLIQIKFFLIEFALMVQGMCNRLVDYQKKPFQGQKPFMDVNMHALFFVDLKQNKLKVLINLYLVIYKVFGSGSMQFSKVKKRLGSVVGVSLSPTVMMRIYFSGTPWYVTSAVL